MTRRLRLHARGLALSLDPSRELTPAGQAAVRALLVAAARAHFAAGGRRNVLVTTSPDGCGIVGATRGRAARVAPRLLALVDEPGVITRRGRRP